MGDAVADLPMFEPASFSRYRFALKTFLPKMDEEEDGDKHDPDADKADHILKKLEQNCLAILASQQRKAERHLARKSREQKKNAKLQRAYHAKESY